MRKSALEAWALAVADQVQAGHEHEDARVELKSKWPDNHLATARQIAGHCNAARGEPVLWLIGLRAGVGVVDPGNVEIDEWWAQVRRWFDAGITPTATFLRVPVGARFLIAILFEADRAPYVVGVEGGGRVQKEVPWREANSTRSATREDLLRILVPAQQLPTLELLSATATLNRTPAEGRDRQARWGADLHIYISTLHAVTLPRHRMALSWRVGESEPIRIPNTRGDQGFQWNVQSPTLGGGEHEIVIQGPGKIRVTVVWLMAWKDEWAQPEALHLEFSAIPALGDVPVVLREQLTRGIEKQHVWHKVG